MPYSCTSPTATSEEDWINEVLLFSPVDLTTSNEAKSSLSLPEFGPTTGHGTEPEFEDLFGTNSMTSETAEDTKPTNHSLLDSVSVKLQRLKEQNCLTPKALESVFNTQDVLANFGDGPLEGTKHKTRRLRASVSVHHEKPGRNVHRKRKNSRAKAPKSAHQNGLHLQHTHTPPHSLRRTSAVSINTHIEDPVSMATSGYETPCFPESWYATPYMPTNGKCIPRAEATENPEFDPLSSLFDHPSNFPPLSDVPDLSDTASSSSSCSFSESPNPLFAPLPGAPFDMAPKKPSANGHFDSAAVQEALAYIDFLQEENMLQQASIEGAI